MNNIISKKFSFFFFYLVVKCSIYSNSPASILYKSIALRYRPVSYPDRPITARYRFIKNAYWEACFRNTSSILKERYLC